MRFAAGCATRLGEAPPAGVWDDVAMPAHLDDAGSGDRRRGPRARGRARRSSAARAIGRGRATFVCARPDPSLDKRGLKAWTFGDLPETLSTVKHGQRLTGYPALVDDADSVSLALLDTRDAAEAATRAGVVRLLRIALKSNLAGYEKGGADSRRRRCN